MSLTTMPINRAQPNLLETSLVQGVGIINSSTVVEQHYETVRFDILLERLFCLPFWV
jgi:hypothetical protein